MAEYTYELPSNERYFFNLDQWLRSNGRQDLLDLIGGRRRFLQDSTSFVGTAYWNHYQVTLTVETPLNEMSRFSEDVKYDLMQAANAVLPRDCGYRITDIDVALAMVEPSEVHGMEDLTERVSVPTLRQLLNRLRNAVGDDWLLIGTAKDSVETTCKTILAERDPSKLTGSPDLPKLIKATLSTLNLVPPGVTGHSRDSIRNLESGLTTAVQSLAELRNRHGSGHGPGASDLGLEPRHARLAVGAAVAVITFLLDTHEEQPK